MKTQGVNIGINTGTNNSPQFTGKVDKSVKRYVKELKSESRKLYKEYCKSSGIVANPTAFVYIDERCDTAYKELKRKALYLHNDTVIKVTKNPYKDEPSLYLCTENKNLLQEWSQSGAINDNIYTNDLRGINPEYKGYDKYITRFEYFAERFKPYKSDEKLVRKSIFNLWNMNTQKIRDKSYSEKQLKLTYNVAKDINYPNLKFTDSLRKHFDEIRNKLQPQKKSFWEKIRDFF